MKVISYWLLPLAVLASAGWPSTTDDPTVVAGLMFDALRSGDSTAVDTLVSPEVLRMVGDNLSTLKDQLRDDPEATMLRLASAGYTAAADEIAGWDEHDYLRKTVALPIMMARYAPYSMEIVSQDMSRNSAVLHVNFNTETGISMPSEIVLARQRGGIWLVSSFMGLNSFP